MCRAEQGQTGSGFCGQWLCRTPGLDPVKHRGGGGGNERRGGSFRGGVVLLLTVYTVEEELLGSQRSGCRPSSPVSDLTGGMFSENTGEQHLQSAVREQIS